MRMRLSWILQPHSNIIARALFSAISAGISLGVMGTAAVLTHSRLVFPSLGPTAFLFFTTPTAPSASPRNTIIGHAIGVCAGYFSLVITGLTMAGPALIFGVTWRHVIAAGLSLALTAGFMVLLRVPHPPAGATTLLVSLGIISKPLQLGVLMVAVGALTLQAIIINRFLGIPFPLWGPLPGSEADPKRDLTSKKKEVSHMPITQLTLGKYLIGMVVSLLMFLAGGWLILAPFALGYQPYGAVWVSQTTNSVATGIPVAVVALVAFAFFVAALLGALRAAGVLTARPRPEVQPTTGLALVPATAQNDLDRTLATLAAALAADLSARRGVRSDQAGDQSIEHGVTRREA